MRTFSRAVFMSLMVLIGYALSVLSQVTKATKPELEAHMPYTPSRIEWMQVRLNSQLHNTHFGYMKWAGHPDSMDELHLIASPFPTNTKGQTEAFEHTVETLLKNAEDELKSRKWDKIIKVKKAEIEEKK